MADWTLTKGLQHLRVQVNAAFPDRDKTSDGTIGDTAHQGETSGHNPDDTAGSKAEYDDHDGIAEVRAWDMDSDLRSPDVTAQDVVDHLRRLPGLGSVIRYMIYNRRMYHVDDGFAPRAYTGPSAHTEHIHFSGARTQAADNNTTFDYHLEDLVALTDSDVARIAASVWGHDVDPSSGGYSAGGALWTMYGRTGVLNRLAEIVAGAVDEQALAAALAPVLVAALPASVDVTPEMLQAAIVAALRQLAAPAV